MFETKLLGFVPSPVPFIIGAYVDHGIYTHFYLVVMLKIS